MTAIPRCIRNGVSATVQFLNQPTVKEGVKNIAGIATFIFGLIEVYDVYQIIQGRDISTDSYPRSPQWVQVANKIVMLCAKISLVLSGGVSRPGVMIFSALSERIFSAGQLNRYFGPNTIFAINPWHPRHVASIAAVILNLPSVLQSASMGVSFIYRKVRQLPDDGARVVRADSVLTDTKVRIMGLFNTITSRPVLHLGNRIGRILSVA